MDPTLVVTLIIGLFGGGAMFKGLTFFADKRKVSADAAAVISGAAVAMLLPLQEQLTATVAEAARLRAEVVELRSQAVELRAEVAALVAKIETMTRKLLAQEG